MRFFEEQALLDEIGYATEDGSVLTYDDIKAFLDHWDSENFPGTMIELAPQEDTAGLKRKYIVLKSDTGESVENCFVLRPDKDEAARYALLAYAHATRNAKLALDVQAWVKTFDSAEEETESLGDNPSTDALSLYLRNLAGSSAGLTFYDRELLRDASKRMDELQAKQKEAGA